MRILLAPDSFKGSMTSGQVIKVLSESAERHFPGCKIVTAPVGDGGEGTADVLVRSLGGHFERCWVSGPLGAPVEAPYGVLDQNTAVIEMAGASGLPLVKREELDPMRASSRGTGELLRHALESGYSTIYLTIGGSATNDGGVGAASALGIRFLDRDGGRPEPNGAALKKIASVDASGMLPALGNARIVIMCDVKNPLLGENGATYVYGGQKGATPELKAELEAGMSGYADVMERACGRRLRNIPGSGAAGGFSIPFLAFTGAVMNSGIDTVLALLGFDRMLDGVDLVVTGEGRIDGQSAQGKVLSGIGAACGKRGIPVAAVAGCLGDGAEDIYGCGVEGFLSCVDRPMSVEEALSEPETKLRLAADRMYRLIRIGMSLGK